jgi:hypothetical protein
MRWRFPAIRWSRPIATIPVLVLSPTASIHRGGDRGGSDGNALPSNSEDLRRRLFLSRTVYRNNWSQQPLSSCLSSAGRCPVGPHSRTPIGTRPARMSLPGRVSLFRPKVHRTKNSAAARTLVAANKPIQRVDGRLIGRGRCVAASDTTQIPTRVSRSTATGGHSSSCTC